MKTCIPVLALLGLSACAVTTPDTSETVGSAELAIRDPQDQICWYVDCDGNGEPLPGGGGGGMGGAGEGTGTVGEGGGAGGGGGGGGSGFGDLPADPQADLMACRTACEAGTGAMGIICTRLPPAARPECYAVGLVGGMACYNFCAWHFT